jgi:hypothetical protein
MAGDGVRFESLEVLRIHPRHEILEHLTLDIGREGGKGLDDRLA